MSETVIEVSERSITTCEKDSILKTSRNPRAILPCLWISSGNVENSLDSIENPSDYIIIFALHLFPKMLQRIVLSRRRGGKGFVP